MRHVTLFTAFLLLSCSFFAQNNPFVHYVNGETINDLAVDGATVWIATAGGLVRNDLQTNVSEIFNRGNSGIPINEVFSVAVAPDGSLWFCTQIGLVHRQGDVWTVMNLASLVAPYDNIVFKRVRVGPDNKVWLGDCCGNLYSYNGTDWTLYNETVLFGYPSINGFDIRPDGKLWVFAAYPNAKFFLFDGQTVLQQDLAGDVPAPVYNFDWKIDANGQIWFLNGQKIGIPNGNTWNLEDVSFISSAIGISPDGTVWCCNNQDQLYRRVSPGNWNTLSCAGVYQFLDYTGNLKLAFDLQGNPLFASNPNGLYHFDGNEFSKIATSTARIPYNGVVKMVTTNTQTIWANFRRSYSILPNGSYNGEKLARFENGQWQWIQNDNAGNNFDNCKDLASDYLGHIWMLEGSELYRYDGQWTSFDGPADPFYGANCVAVRPGTEEVWVGGQGKIARLNGTQFQIFNMPEDYMDVTRMAIGPNGNVWIPIYTDDHCLGRFDGQQWTLYTYDDVKIPQDGEYGIINVSTGPDGKIWLIADHHISFFDGFEWTALDLGNDNLETLASIAFDGPDKIWIGTYHEYCYMPDVHLNLIKVENSQITLYPYETTPLAYPNSTALVVDSLHNLWIGTSRGGIVAFKENGIILGTQSHVLSGRNTLKAYVYPNPVNDIGVITCEIPEVSDIFFELGSMDGALLRSEKIEKCPQGTFEWPIENAGFSGGTYWWRVRSASAVACGKVVLIK